MNTLEQTVELISVHGLNADLADRLAGLLEEAGLLRSDHPDEGEVMAIRHTGNNSDLIADAFRLGYLNDDMAILDPTYGMGVFWKRHRPPKLIGTDLDPAKSPGGDVYVAGCSFDFTKMPWDDWQFDAVVFDPDYKMQGTDSGAGPASSNHRYGMSREYRPVEEQLGIIGKGLRECVRVTKPRGMVLVKYMSQVVSGSIVWQEFDIPFAMQEFGCELIDSFHLEGYRKQPTHDRCKACDGTGWRRHTVDPSECWACDSTGKVPRRQAHARRNYSTLGIFRRQS